MSKFELNKSSRSMEEDTMNRIQPNFFQINNNEALSSEV